MRCWQLAERLHEEATEAWSAIREKVAVAAIIAHAAEDRGERAALERSAQQVREVARAEWTKLKGDLFTAALGGPQAAEAQEAEQALEEQVSERRDAYAGILGGLQASIMHGRVADAVNIG